MYVSTYVCMYVYQEELQPDRLPQDRGGGRGAGSGIRCRLQRRRHRFTQRPHRLHTPTTFVYVCTYVRMIRPQHQQSTFLSKLSSSLMKFVFACMCVCGTDHLFFPDVDYVHSVNIPCGSRFGWRFNHTMEVPAFYIHTYIYTSYPE